MRRFAAAWALSVFVAMPALAQDNSVIAVPLAPPIMAAPVAPAAPPAPAAVVPPGLVQTPVPPANSDTGSGNGNSAGSASDGTASDNGTAAPDGGTPAVVNAWQPQQTAQLGVLDKVDGSSQVVAIAVGGAQKIGDLQVQVLACVVRPAGQIPDAAMFVAVTLADGSSAVPLYRGWMIKSAPAAAVVGDAGETFRVAGCG